MMNVTKTLVPKNPECIPVKVMDVQDFVDVGIVVKVNRGRFGFGCVIVVGMGWWPINKIRSMDTVVIVKLNGVVEPGFGRGWCFIRGARPVINELIIVRGRDVVVSIVVNVREGALVQGFVSRTMERGDMSDVVGGRVAIGKVVERDTFGIEYRSGARSVAFFLGREKEPVCPGDTADIAEGDREIFGASDAVANDQRGRLIFLDVQDVSTVVAVANEGRRGYNCAVQGGGKETPL